MNVDSLINLNGKRVVLASASPRRAHLLKLVGFDFDVIASNFDEADEIYTIPEVHVLELSQKKATKVAETINDGFIVGADTIVVLDKEIIEKPADSEEAVQMLQRLSGRTHTVFTGFTIIEKPGGKTFSDYEKTEVHFRHLSEQEIAAYVKTESSLDKAGAYGIQDQGALFVKGVNGCFYNVMGFPVTKFYRSLRRFVA